MGHKFPIGSKVQDVYGKKFLTNGYSADSNYVRLHELDSKESFIVSDSSLRLIEPNIGDVIQVKLDGGEWKNRIFLYTRQLHAICVCLDEEAQFQNNDRYSVVPWGVWRIPPVEPVYELRITKDGDIIPTYKVPEDILTTLLPHKVPEDISTTLLPHKVPEDILTT